MGVWCLTERAFGDIEPAVLHPAAGELVVVGVVSLRGRLMAKLGIRVLIGGVLASAAAGCASGSPDPLASQSGRQVLVAAVGNLKAAPSFTMSGNVTQSAGTFTVDLGYRRGKGCTGTVVQAGRGSFTMTVIATTAWVRPDATFWKSIAGSQAASVISAVGGKFLTGPTSDRAIAGLTSMCDVNSLAAQLQEPSTVVKDAVTPLAGTQAVPLTDVTEGGKLYVTDTASPQVIEMTNHTSGSMTFHIGAPVRLAPPPSRATVNGARFGL
jgi:hypothetical protein